MIYKILVQNVLYLTHMPHLSLISEERNRPLVRSEERALALSVAVFSVILYELFNYYYYNTLLLLLFYYNILLYIQNKERYFIYTTTTIIISIIYYYVSRK
jgi:hypothetical protein